MNAADSIYTGTSEPEQLLEGVRGMADLRVMTTRASDTVLKESAVEEFKSNLRGELIRPGDRLYDDVRRVWNHLIDRRPALIARCSGVSDIINCVDFARANDLLVAVRGGGHNIAGSAVCDDGLMIDLSLMKSVRVDLAERIAQAEPGATWRDFDWETQAFGLATTGGVVSMTGIAGLTLGGGVGWLMRKYGLTCDNLLSCNVVTADGRFLKASTTENPDLFWGLSGGGGNFGIVTSFEYRLHPVGPTVLAGAVAYPFSQAKEVLKFYREYVNTIPDELTTMLALSTPADQGPIIAIAVCYSGSIEEGEEAVRPLREFGKPLADQIGPVPYLQHQSARDARYIPGPKHYWKDNFMTEINDSAIDTIVEHFASVPSKQSAITIAHMGGAVSRVSKGDTAFYYRDMVYDFIILSMWSDSLKSEENIRWTDQFWEALRPDSARAVYVNDLGDEGDERVREAYGDSYPRLVDLKNRYDPTNMFRMNQNIRPTTGSPVGRAPT